MAITFTGTTGTFSDGSTQTGSYPAGVTTPDGNTSRTATSFNIGHIILANTIFYANAGSGAFYSIGGTRLYGMNMTNQGYFMGNAYAGATLYSVSPGTNTTYPTDHPRHGSQSYFALGTGNLGGSWRVRGMACAAGINQTNGFFVLLERVA